MQQLKKVAHVAQSLVLEPSKTPYVEIMVAKPLREMQELWGAGCVLQQLAVAPPCAAWSKGVHEASADVGAARLSWRILDGEGGE